MRWRIRVLQPKDVAHRQHMIDSLQVYVSMFSGPLFGLNCGDTLGQMRAYTISTPVKLCGANTHMGEADDVRTFPIARTRKHVCSSMFLTRLLLAALVAHHCILLQWNFDPPRHHVMRDPSKHPENLEELRPQWATPPCSEIKPSV